jgi:hypothetical protein
MIRTDKSLDGPRLVTDYPGTYQTEQKPARLLEPGDHITVGFAGYGDLVMTVVETQERREPHYFAGQVLDVRVETPPATNPAFGTTTVLPADGDVRVYSASAAGKWLR